MSDDKIKRPRIKSTVVASHFPTVFMVREYADGASLNRKLEELMLRSFHQMMDVARKKKLSTRTAALKEWS